MGVTTTSVFIFRRDLRIYDNMAFFACCEESTTVIPIFVFTPEQIDPKKNPYFSHAAVQFMCESLQDLSNAFKKHQRTLNLYHDDNIHVLEKLYKKHKFDRVYFNKDHTVYANHRDAAIARWCEKNNVEVHADYEDYTLVPLHEGLVSENKPYTILAQFYNRYLKNLEIPKVNKTIPMLSKCIVSTNISESIDLSKLYDHNPDLVVQGGREEALKKLKRLGSLKNTYGTHRDFPYEPQQTTRMSAYLKFGCLSIREMYWECVKVFGSRDHPLIRELFFREFYTKIYSLRPELQRTEAFLPKIESQRTYLKPSSEAFKKAWTAWTTGTTGFPLVDAGMRQLLKEGFTHNRVRMVQGSIATRVLNLDWRDCAKYYATKLVDICPYVNTASWQWCAGVGVDAMWYRPPFNPFIQSKKFDPDCIYIKQYLPELRDVEPKHIHTWWNPKTRALYPNIEYGGQKQNFYKEKY